MNEITELPLPVLAALVSDKRVRPSELVRACLAQVDRWEDHIHAWVRLDAEGALAAAAELDREQDEGRWRGPLHGIPVGVKDIVDVAGWPTLAGSTTRLGHVAEADAPVVRRLRAAGAIVLGKTVTTEFASFDPPSTRNPWNLQRTPGGSSSGSAAAVATRMCLAAIGSQTGGSITRPASFCGVAGLKPTWGRTSTRGVVPLSWHLDHVGPIGRNVADLAAMLEAMAGHDPDDPWSVDIPAERYFAALDNPQPPRLGLLREFFLDGATASVRREVLRAVEGMRAAGAAVVEVPLPASFAEVIACHRAIMVVEAATYHREAFLVRRNDYGPCIAALIDEGLATPSTVYAAALVQQRRWRHDLAALLDAQRLDAVLAPAAVTTAPARDTTGDPLFNSPWSHAGVPAVSLPVGLAGDGLPVAVQLCARPWAEAALLAAASWCERAVAFQTRPAAVAADRATLAP